jgi:hypothetical protein
MPKTLLPYHPSLKELVATITMTEASALVAVFWGNPAPLRGAIRADRRVRVTPGAP